MSAKRKAIFCWSGGKDSSLALYRILRSGEWEICYLLSTLNGNNHRISMHGVREALLDAQAAALGIPLLKVFTYEASNVEYEKQMEAVLLQAKAEGIDQVIFGDIFLEDLRAYRENNLAKIGMKAVFPLWKEDTKELVHEFLSLGFKTITCCVNDAFLNETHVGQMIGQDFIDQLPLNVDPCGENGEFHTFCFDGPLFKQPVHFQIAEKIYRPLLMEESNDDSVCKSEHQTKGFWYCELLPVD